MPYLTLDPDCELYYVDDDYTPPWEEREVAMLVHGVRRGHMPKLPSCTLPCASGFPGTESL